MFHDESKWLKSKEFRRMATLNFNMRLTTCSVKIPHFLGFQKVTKKFSFATRGIQCLCSNNEKIHGFAIFYSDLIANTYKRGISLFDILLL
jgi:hypothetical protein